MVTAVQKPLYLSSSTVTGAKVTKTPGERSEPPSNIKIKKYVLIKKLALKEEEEDEEWGCWGYGEGDCY